MSQNNRHVVPNNKDWRVIKAGGERGKNFDTKAEAVDYARDLARRNKEELVIHNRDGQISYRDSYGNDPSRHRG